MSRSRSRLDLHLLIFFMILKSIAKYAIHLDPLEMMSKSNLDLDVI